MKIVKESLLEFHKGGDPFASLGIGPGTQREFNNYNELYQWVLSFPGVISNGIIDNYIDMFDGKGFSGLYLLKWLLNNVTIDGKRPSLKDLHENIYLKLKKDFKIDYGEI